MISFSFFYSSKTKRIQDCGQIQKTDLVKQRKPSLFDTSVKYRRRTSYNRGNKAYSTLRSNTEDGPRITEGTKRIQHFGQIQKTDLM